MFCAPPKPQLSSCHSSTGPAAPSAQQGQWLGFAGPGLEAPQTHLDSPSLQWLPGLPVSGSGDSVLTPTTPLPALHRLPGGLGLCILFKTISPRTWLESHLLHTNPACLPLSSTLPVWNSPIHPLAHQRTNHLQRTHRDHGQKPEGGYSPVPGTSSDACSVGVGRGS